MGLMELPIHLGPRNPELLTLQKYHKNQAIWDRVELRPLRCRSHIRVLEDFDVDDRVVEFLRGTHFFGIHRFVSMKFYVDLISSLVELWRQETHTFHLPVGEVTVTLKDVQVLLGLAINGDVVSGSTYQNPVKSVEMALGLAPTDDDLSGTALKIGLLVRNFRGLPNNVSEEVLHNHVRAYLLILFGIVLYPDKSRSDVQVIWLPLLSDLDHLDKYSWGSMPATLYRNLCRASRVRAIDIGGPLILLQIWAWERISIGRPNNLRPRYEAWEPNANPFGSQHQIRVDLLGCRWLRIERKRPSGPSSFRGYGDALDSMTNDHFIWQHYTEEIMFFLSDECKSQP
ncbi:serine/threonine-protein phosphatase 7 long form homolog [Silene latifolia]|uniref:serine/threonine-protein phosphatase 7 long form homolog n=1 Tax=Silene latifolia TaxID=37657 RepID=UPI003D76A7CF